jgi:recombination protein RecT
MMSTNLSTWELFKTEETQSKFKELLWVNANSFITTVISIVNSNDLLKDADPQSIYNVALTSASMRLPINPNLWFAYIIPYQKKKKVDGKRVNDWQAIAQFQMWYKWFKQLALRSQEFVSIHATDVREWEILNHDRLSWEITFQWIENNDDRKKKKIVWYVSHFKLISWFTSTLYMTIDDLKEHGLKYSQSFKKWYWLWIDDPDWMYLKTVTKLNLSKNAPLSVEMQRAIIADQWVIKDDNLDNVEYVDNEEKGIVIENDINVDLLNDWEKKIKECKTLSELSQLFDQNKPTDPAILSLYTTRKNELNQSNI